MGKGGDVGQVDPGLAVQPGVCRLAQIGQVDAAVDFGLVFNAHGNVDAQGAVVARLEFNPGAVDGQQCVVVLGHAQLAFVPGQVAVNPAQPEIVQIGRAPCRDTGDARGGAVS